MYLSAKTMAELIESIRAKAFEDVAKVVSTMEADKGGFVYLPDVINIIDSVDERLRNQEETPKEEVSESR
jgi:hypothetical protein